MKEFAVTLGDTRNVANDYKILLKLVRVEEV